MSLYWPNTVGGLQTCSGYFHTEEVKNWQLEEWRENSKRGTYPRCCKYIYTHLSDYITKMGMEAEVYNKLAAVSTLRGD